MKRIAAVTLAFLLSGCAADIAAIRSDITRQIHPRLDATIVGQPLDVALKREGSLPDNVTPVGNGDVFMSWSRETNTANYGAAPQEVWCTEVVKVSRGTVVDWRAQGALCA